MEAADGKRTPNPLGGPDGSVLGVGRGRDVKKRVTPDPTLCEASGRPTGLAAGVIMNRGESVARARQRSTPVSTTGRSKRRRVDLSTDQDETPYEQHNGDGQEKLERGHDDPRCLNA